MEVEEEEGDKNCAGGGRGKQNCGGGGGEKLWKRRENKMLEEELEGVVRKQGYC